jgi:hypothetical protein
LEGREGRGRYFGSMGHRGHSRAGRARTKFSARQIDVLIEKVAP